MPVEDHDFRDKNGDHVQVTDIVINHYRNEITSNTIYTTRITLSTNFKIN